MAHTANADLQACIEACLRCYQTCLGMMTNPCVEAGGPHVEPEHVRLMLSCAETCRACAHLMVIGSAVHRHQCRACAEICAACAASCEAVGDMDDCVRACRTCAETCRRMAA